jgi:translation initiation factor 1
MEIFEDTKNDMFAGVITSKIHIRTQNMGRKWVTTVDGLDEDLDLERIAKAMKKSLHCATTVIKNKDDDEVIQLQGNHADVLKQWLIEMQILTEKEAAERVIIHGSV